jgi:hypothetical protein
MKMGTAASPWRYDAIVDYALQPDSGCGYGKIIHVCRLDQTVRFQPGSQESSQPDASAAINNTRPGGARPLTQTRLVPVKEAENYPNEKDHITNRGGSP